MHPQAFRFATPSVLALGLLAAGFVSPAYASQTFPVPIGRNLFCEGKRATIVGAGEIWGTPGDDVIVGSNGDDRIFGGLGNDIICGNGGNDYLRGGYGDDHLYGGPGDDIVAGNWGYDWVYGDDGNDMLYANWEQEEDADFDILMGGAGNDHLFMGTATYACGEGIDYRHEWNPTTNTFGPPIIC
jgi:hypothetical protein